MSLSQSPLRQSWQRVWIINTGLIYVFMYKHWKHLCMLQFSGIPKYNPSYTQAQKPKQGYLDVFCCNFLPFLNIYLGYSIIKTNSIVQWSFTTYVCDTNEYWWQRQKNSMEFIFNIIIFFLLYVPLPSFKYSSWQILYNNIYMCNLKIQKQTNKKNTEYKKKRNRLTDIENTPV